MGLTLIFIVVAILILIRFILLNVNNYKLGIFISLAIINIGLVVSVIISAIYASNQDVHIVEQTEIVSFCGSDSYIYATSKGKHNDTYVKYTINGNNIDEVRNPIIVYYEGNENYPHIEKRSYEMNKVAKTFLFYLAQWEEYIIYLPKQSIEYDIAKTMGIENE